MAKNLYSLTEERKQILFDAAEKYWRSEGFPYEYKEHTDVDLWEKFFSLQDIKGTLRQKRFGLFYDEEPTSFVSSEGIGIANYFNPEIWHSQRLGGRSPIDAFENKKLFRRALEIILSYDRRLTPTSIRNVLRIVRGTQTCSNFRPAVAKTVYDQFAGQANSIVLDPCMGYGGRLLGWMASNIHKKHKGSHLYVGVDPNHIVCKNNTRMAQFFGFENNIKLINKPFEDVPIKELQKFQPIFAFTSPPYFDRERYSTDESQSCKRYPKYEDWKKNFLAILIEHAHSILRKDSKFLLNINNIKIQKNKILPLAEDAKVIAEKCGFTLVETFQYHLSKFGKGLGESFGEPMFLFQKK